MAASSSMTRMRGLFNFDGVELAARDLGFVEIQREHFARPGMRSQAAVILNRSHWLTVDFEQDMAPLDVGIERWAHRVHARHDDALEPFWKIEALREFRIDLAHGESERRTRNAGRPGLVARRLTLAQRTLGQLHRHIERSPVAHDL